MHIHTQAVIARLEVCMAALGLSLAPLPTVDLDSVPLERLLPQRAAHGAGRPTSHQVWVDERAGGRVAG